MTTVLANPKSILVLILLAALAILTLASGGKGWAYPNDDAYYPQSDCGSNYTFKLFAGDDNECILRNYTRAEIDQRVNDLTKRRADYDPDGTRVWSQSPLEVVLYWLQQQVH